MFPHPPSIRRWASLPFGRTSFPFLYRISAHSLHLVYIHEIGRTPPSPAALLLLLLPLLLQLANAAADTTALNGGKSLLIQSLPRIIILVFQPFGKAPSFCALAAFILPDFSSGILLSLFLHPFRRAISFSIISTYLMYFCASTGMMDMMYCIS